MEIESWLAGMKCKSYSTLSATLASDLLLCKGLQKHQTLCTFASLEDRYGCSWRLSSQNKRSFFEFKPLAARIKSIREVQDWDEVIRLAEIERNGSSVLSFAKACRERHPGSSTSPAREQLNHILNKIINYEYQPKLSLKTLRRCLLSTLNFIGYLPFL